MNNKAVCNDDSIKITASGYIHLNALSERVEYLYGIIPTTPISDEKTTGILADYIARENQLNVLSPIAQLSAVRELYRYLRYEATKIAAQAGAGFDDADENSGASYVLRRVNAAIARASGRGRFADQMERDLLD